MGRKLTVGEFRRLLDGVPADVPVTAVVEPVRPYFTSHPYLVGAGVTAGPDGDPMMLHLRLTFDPARVGRATD